MKQGNILIASCSLWGEHVSRVHILRNVSKRRRQLKMTRQVSPSWALPGPTLNTPLWFSPHSSTCRIAFWIQFYVEINNLLAMSGRNATKQTSSRRPFPDGCSPFPLVLCDPAHITSSAQTQRGAREAWTHSQTLINAGWLGWLNDGTCTGGWHIKDPEDVATETNCVSLWS